MYCSSKTDHALTLTSSATVLCFGHEGSSEEAQQRGFMFPKRAYFIITPFSVICKHQAKAAPELLLLVGKLWL